MHHLFNQSINYTIILSIPVHQVNRSINLCIIYSINQLKPFHQLNRSFNYCIIPFHQLNRSINYCIVYSINQSINQSLPFHLHSLPSRVFFTGFHRVVCCDSITGSKQTNLEEIRKYLVCLSMINIKYSYYPFTGLLWTN